MFHLIETHFRCVFFIELTILVWLTTSIKIHSIDDDEWIFNVNHAQRSVLTLVYPTWACVCVRARPPVCVCACSLLYTYIRGMYRLSSVNPYLIHTLYIVHSNLYSTVVPHNDYSISSLFVVDSDRTTVRTGCFQFSFVSYLVFDAHEAPSYGFCYFASE